VRQGCRRPRSLKQLLLLKVAVRTRIIIRRSPITTTSCWQALPLSLLSQQQLVGAMAHTVTRDRASSPTAMRAGRGAWCTTPGTTMLRSVGRSRTLWNSSMSSRSSSRTMTAQLPASGKASSKLPTRPTMRRWSSKMPRGRSRSSMTTLTQSPVTMSAASSSTPSTMAPGTPRPSSSSRHCVGWWQPLHLSQE
jgi:hypothetical protein